MPGHNSDVAAIFGEIADLLEVQGANVFRIRAYRNAARTIGDQPSDLGALRAQGKPLTELPGIGADLAGKINEILDTGKCAFLKQLRTEVPAGASELLRISGLGPSASKPCCSSSMSKIWNNCARPPPQGAYMNRGVSARRRSNIYLRQ